MKETVTRPPELSGLLHGFVLRLRTRLTHVSQAHARSYFAALETMPAPFTLLSIYWAGRFTLCARREDLLLYDECFREFFVGGVPSPTSGDNSALQRVTGLLASCGEDEAAEAEDRKETQALSANVMEVLRGSDFTTMSQAELSEVLRLIETLRFSYPLRQNRYRRSSHLGPLHAQRTVRAALEQHGEFIRLVRARADLRPRRCVLLIDVSGSMRGYAEPLLRFGYAMTNSMPRVAEVFSMGSRLARLTPLLGGQAPQVAMRAVTRSVVDWGGGTRLGSGLQGFLNTWGQRGMARGAVVIIASDGWESGGAELLAEQMARLRRLAYKVIWVNPHKSSEGYEPSTAGMKAALPYVDNFVGGASLAELVALGQTIGSVAGSEFKRKS
ncbi:VWA domain-containing protein [Pseudomonas sp. 5Ae-yellow]|uniref:vWA domain-containing protein n=1 Tax=Pseudomonas sp. 5Ae-yellow TaxID=2759848 RepID=UPI0015F38F49|nr:VWA domain-containing protein [Pseudomonas sp. 5Ae-yellow]MBA6420991.1 VWA domain-containing protein [Pseudomonas sp. 5Ae-yellow]